MRKIFILVFLLSLLSFPPVKAEDQKAFRIMAESDLPKADAYKAIVEIKSFVLNPDYELSLFGSGSGVIIDPSGIVLTNHHVVTSKDDFDNTEKEVSYIICLTEDIAQKADCKYTGRLIASDKDLDIALLKINNIAGLGGKNSFSYLDLNSNDATEINNEITALGYPAIGGDTITITKGVISGKENKYNKDWLKTDAVISYGSSGGAAIDVSGKVIGITSSSHSDRRGSLGYIINITSLNGWISANKGKAAQSSSLISRTELLAKKVISLKNSNEFINNIPAYKITKPSDWDFMHEDETLLFINKEDDDGGGVIIISVSNFPYAIDTGIVEGSIKKDLLFLISMASIMKNENATINGREAKKVIISAIGKQSNYYHIPVGNYLLKVSYDYGENDKDKTVVDNIINSIMIIGVPQYTEITNYSHNNPKFNISLNNGWALLHKNSKDYPLFITYKQDKLVFADIKILKTDDNTKNMSNEEYLNFVEQQLKEVNSLASIYDIRSEIAKKDARYKLNNNLSDVIMTEIKNKSISTGEVLSQNRGYYIKTGDKYIMPSLNYYSGNNSGYDDMVNKFEQALQTLSLDSRPTVSQNNPILNITQAINIKNPLNV